MKTKPMYRRVIVLVALVLVLGGAYLAYDLSAARRSGGVPPEFADARARGGAVSQDIVEKSNEVAEAIAHLNDTNPTYAQASSTLNEILEKIEDIRIQALWLAEELNTMGESLQDIRPLDARQAAFQSVYYHVYMVEGLVQYTQKVAQLAIALQLNLESNAQNGDEINELVRDINRQVSAINDFNKEAVESMEQFDEILRR